MGDDISPVFALVKIYYAMKPENIDEYIAAYPADIQTKLQELRQTIRLAAPAAEETIKYGMPTFTLMGNLVYFGGFKNHIGFYPRPKGVPEFEAELAHFDGPPSTIQFPYTSPLPHDLITRIVKYRANKNAKAKK